MVKQSSLLKYTEYHFKNALGQQCPRDWISNSLSSPFPIFSPTHRDPNKGPLHCDAKWIWCKTNSATLLPDGT